MRTILERERKSHKALLTEDKKAALVIGSLRDEMRRSYDPHESHFAPDGRQLES